MHCYCSCSAVLAGSCQFDEVSSCSTNEGIETGLGMAPRGGSFLVLIYLFPKYVCIQGFLAGFRNCGCAPSDAACRQPRNLLRRVIEVKPIPWWDQWGMNALLNDEVCMLKPKLQNTCMNIGMCMHYIMHAYILCMQYLHIYIHLPMATLLSCLG